MSGQWPKEYKSESELADEQLIKHHIEKFIGECNLKTKAPYPWCSGNPTVLDCVNTGYCGRNPNCGE